MSENFRTEKEAVDAFMADVLSEGFVDFDGKNCEEAWDEGEDCAGWDGVSRRCDCGNRRVTLLTAENGDGTWMAYAEAY